MSALQILSARHWRTILVLLILLGWHAMTVPFAAAQNPTDATINQTVWQQLYGVPADSAMDMNGMMHSDEATAGIVPGKGIKFQVSTFSTSGSNSLLTFPSIIGKYYTVQSKALLQSGSWSPVPNVFLIGDGTTHTMTVPSSSGPYFKVVVQDSSSANDDVSDWAKAMLGYSSASLASQTGGNLTVASLRTALLNTNIVTVAATDATATEPPDAVTAPSDLGVFTFTRSGYQLFSSITVPIATSGTAVSGADYVALPSSVTFAPGVSSVSVNVTPLYNPNRVAGGTLAGQSATLTVTAGAGGGYTLGTATSASMTIYPPSAGGSATGTGLSAVYYNGSNVLYSNAAGLGVASATYVFTQLTATTGNIVITYTGAPLVPYQVGYPVVLSFTSGLLNSTAYNGTTNVFSSAPYSPYTISAVSAPGATPTTITVPIATDGISLPANTSGNVTLNPFAGPTQASNFGGSAVNYNYTKVTGTTGTAVISYPGAPTAAFTAGSSVALQFTGGNLFTSVSGLYDGTYTVSAPSGPVTFSGTSLISIASPMKVTTSTPHGFVAGTPVTFTTTGALPTGLTASTTTTSTTYYVLTAGLTGTQFEVSASPPPSTTAVNTSGTQSGTQTVQSASFTVPITAPSGVASLPASGAGAGNLTPFTAPVVNRVDPTVDFLWGTGQPSNASLQTATSNNWSARWDGYLVPPTTGSYSFVINANDGARVYVNGALVIDAWAPGSSTYTPETSSPVQLTGGVPVLLRVEYYHLNANSGLADLNWLTPGAGSYTDIPVGDVFQSSTGTGLNGYTGLYWSNIGTSSATPSTSTVTISGPATPAVVSWANHGLLPGTPVVFSTTGALPAGLTAGTTYYVSAAGMTTGSFEVSATLGGSVVNTTGAGTGTQTATTTTDFANLPRYGDYPTAISNLTWTSQPTATLPNANNYAIRWDGYLSPTETSTVTMTTANPCVVTYTNHGLQAGATVVFGTTGTLPSAITAGTTYYVISAGLAANTFEISATPGGSAISTASETQSGTQTATASAGGTSSSYTFDVQAGDGARVYVDLNQNGTFDLPGDLIIDDSGGNSGNPLATTSSVTLAAGQQYKFRVEYINVSNATPLLKVRMSGGGGTMAPIPVGCVLRADPLSGAATSITGLWATCFSNTAFTGSPLFAQQDPSTSNSSSSGLGNVTGAGTLTDTFSLTSKISGSVGTAGSNNYSGKYTAYLKADGTHTAYTFQLVAPSAGQVLINGVPQLPTFTSGTSTFTYNFATATTVVPLTVEFYDTVANGSVTLNWSPGSTGTYALIPAANFYLDAAGTQQNPTTGSPSGSVTCTYYANSAMIGDPYYSDYRTQINSGLGSSQPSDAWGAITTNSATWDGYIAAASAGTYQFSLQAQSKARLYINNTLVIDGWTVPGSSASVPITGSIALPGGAAGTRVPIHVDFESGTAGAFIYLLWQSPSSASLVNLANSACFMDATSTQQGLLATYYTNATQTPPAFYQVAENNSNEVYYFFGTGLPAPLLPDSSLTARWTGQVLPQYTEPYYFTVKSDDGARLWVNGQLVINKWQSQSVTENIAPVPISLQAGVYYDIKVEYLNISGSAEVHLNWYSADQVEQVIPMSRLFPTSTGTAGSGATAVTSTANDLYVAGSGTAYSYTITGSDGPGTYSATGLAALGLSLNGNVISGTPTVGPGTYQFTVATTNANGTSTQVVTLQIVAGAGTITRELYSLSGPNISDLVLAIQSGQATSQVPDTVTTTQDATAYGSNTGERLRGYITAPATGNYYFWIAGSGTPVDANHNAAELWISDSQEPVAKIKRCYVAGPNGTGSGVYNAQTNQQSGWISLVGGQQYYFEILHNTGNTTTTGPSNLSVGWFLDPTGNTANPIANSAGPAAASAGGIIPGYVLSPWNNPPTTTQAGTIYLASLGAPASLINPTPPITGSGGAYVMVNGSTGIVHANYSGLTSGATTVQIYATGGTSPIFDLGAQNKNGYPQTSDGGYTWNMQASDLTNLQAGKVYFVVATTNYPITPQNPYGELTGFFGKVSGSQLAPALPSYPTWTDDSSTAVGASRFLTQATFGPSPSDMTSVQASGYRTWLENQFTLGPTYTVPYILSHLSGDPQNPYNDPLFFNSWWKNSVTGPDQLRQRVAFALSEILVTSDVGPLNNNDRPLADYYDTLLQYAFTDFRTLLKQVSLTSAMGVYLNMEANPKGSYQTGLHPNENYGREIMQLFSIGLYRLWPDGTLVLDSTGEPIPTYNQAVITGVSHALTGWSYGQPLSGGRLPTGGPATNYLDPMVLLSNQHELGTKQLLDNVVLPPAVVVSQSDTSHDPAPASYQLTIQSTSPTLGPGNLVTTTITSTYDLYALHDFEYALNSIMNNGDVGPYVCRQLIQRLVTSNPKPAYVYRVVRAFNGELNIDGVSTGVVGDLKEVIRAILLDPEARSATSAADIGFGKQREPLLRVTGPARTFPPTGIVGASYEQWGDQFIHIKSPSVAHRLTNSDTVLLNTWTDTNNSTSNLPFAQGYSVANITSGAYDFSGGANGTANIWIPGYQTSDTVNIQFTAGNLNAGPYNTVQNYTVTGRLAPNSTHTSGGFTVNVGNSAIPISSIATGNPCTITTSTPHNLANGVSVVISGVTGGTFSPNIDQTTGFTVTVKSPTTFTVASNFSNASGVNFTNAAFTNNLSTNVSNGVFTPNDFTVTETGIITPTYTVGGSNNQTVTVNSGSGYITGDKLYIKFTSGVLYNAGYDGVYAIQSATGNSTFTIPLASSPGTGTLTGGSTLIPKVTGGYTVVTAGSNSTITLQSGVGATAANFDLAIGDQIWIDFPVTISPLGATSGMYTVSAIPAPNLLSVQSPTPITAGTESTNGYVAYPQNLNAATRSGTVNVNFGSWNVGNTTTNSTLDQAPLNSTTVFNFFYPSYQYPGTIAAAGMTTPEFQLTDASDTLNLTNAVNNGTFSSSTTSAGNTFGYTSFFTGNGAVVLDLGQYMTGSQTQDSAIPGLVSTLGTLLCGGNLSSANQTVISNYVTANVNAAISSISTGNPCIVNISTAHNLTSGTNVAISGVTGGTFSPSINGTYIATVISPTQFTVPVNCTSTSGISYTNATYKSTQMPNTVMRDRIRAILQLILTSAEYSIQK